MPTKNQNAHTVRLLLALLLLGDTLVSFVGLSVAYFLRFETALRRVGVDTQGATYGVYLPLIYVGTIFFAATFVSLAAYDRALLLRPNKALNGLVRGVFFWFVTYLGTSLVLKFEPPISRLFMAIAFITTLLLLAAWRYAFHWVLTNSSIRDSVSQTVVFLGWSTEAERLFTAIQTDNNHPYDVLGYVATSAQSSYPRSQARALASLDTLEEFLHRRPVDILVVADLDLHREELLQIASLCERHYVAFKIIPSFFQIFISHLRLQTISGISILGVEALPLNSLTKQILKRMTDIVGGLVGLIGSLPVMIVLGILIRRESPGPVIYRQIRVGLNGRPFSIYKLRSMRVDAETATGPRWATADDKRRLRIGAFMREWNLDELPQFWNVIKGDMSLVGPRPERPELIAEFERTIPHYNPRHSVRPGLSGWAQVNGLRGNTSLVERVRYDLYYIENWSLWFDIQIMLLTFTRRTNAY